MRIVIHHMVMVKDTYRQRFQFAEIQYRSPLSVISLKENGAAIPIPSDREPTKKRLKLRTHLHISSPQFIWPLKHSVPAYPYCTVSAVRVDIREMSRKPPEDVWDAQSCGLAGTFPYNGSAGA